MDTIPPDPPNLPMPKLTPHLKAIAAELLDIAADEFSNHGCNDYRLENTDENWALVKATWEGNEPFPDRRPKNGPIYTQNWILMRYFAKLLRDG